MYEGDYAYAATRLEGTIVRRGDTPVWIIRVRNDGTVTYQTVITGKEGECHLDDLNLIPVPLGYINTEKFGAVYVVRRPMRRDWRQGLRPLNMVPHDMHINPELIPFPDIGRTIKGNYKSFDECRKAVEGGAKSIAWHRDWAVGHALNVFYRGRRVGRVVDARVILNEGYEYLREALEEAL